MATEERIAKKNVDLRNTFTFKLEKKVDSGEEFTGTFVLHRPTIGERINIGVVEAQRLGGLVNVDVYTAGLAHMLSTLEIVVDSAPNWWKPAEIRDVEVIQEVYNKYIDYLNSFSARPGSENDSGAAA